MYMIKDMQSQERPRERLMRFGAHSLSTYELIAILLRTGIRNESVIDVSRHLIADMNKLSDLKDMSIKEMMAFRGIGKTKAITLKAALELGKRVIEERVDKLLISSPKIVYDLLNYDLRDLKQEVLMVLYLDLKTNLIAKKEVFRGSLNQSLVHPREIFKYAVKYSAYQIILVHNHPSGDPTPSDQDIKLTKAVEKAGQMMQIHLLDHIIIGHGNYQSINHYLNQ